MIIDDTTKKDDILEETRAEDILTVITKSVFLFEVGYLSDKGTFKIKKVINRRESRCLPLHPPRTIIRPSQQTLILSVHGMAHEF